MITVWFSCKECGLVNEPVQVRAQPSEEDLMAWMALVSRSVATAHGAKHLMCEAKTFDLVISTFPEAEWVGQEPPPGHVYNTPPAPDSAAWSPVK